MYTISIWRPVCNRGCLQFKEKVEDADDYIYIDEESKLHTATNMYISLSLSLPPGLSQQIYVRYQQILDMELMIHSS